MLSFYRCQVYVIGLIDKSNVGCASFCGIGMMYGWSLFSDHMKISNFLSWRCHTLREEALLKKEGQCLSCFLALAQRRENVSRSIRWRKKLKNLKYSVVSRHRTSRDYEGHCLCCDDLWMIWIWFRLRMIWYVLFRFPFCLRELSDKRNACQLWW